MHYCERSCTSSAFVLHIFSGLLLDRDLCFLKKRQYLEKISIYYKSVKLLVTSSNSVANVCASLLSYIHSYYISLTKFLVPTG